MESSRGILLLALAFITFLLYQQWQTDYAPIPTPKPKTEVTSQTNTGLPEVSSKSTSTSDIPDVTPEKSSAVSSEGKTVTLASDVLEVTVDTHGGDVVSAKLLTFNEKLNDPSEKVQLLTNEDGRTFIAKSALLGDDAPDTSTTRANYEVLEQTSTDTKHKLTLKWVNQSGVEFLKTFTLENGHFDVGVSYTVNNTSDTKLDFRMLNQLNRDRYVTDTGTGFGIQAYTGAAFASEESNYEKYDFDDMDDANLNVKTTGGWIAFLQHYFLTAWVPEQDAVNQITTQVIDGNVSIIRVLQEWVSVSPGSSKIISSQLYLGPKDQEVLAELAKGLDLTVDYSIFWWIGQPIFFLLTFFHQYIIANWGVAIILVTLTVKVLLYPLANAQYRSFAKMRLLAPKLQQLKERHGDDRQKMSMAMMELYKKEKVNPMGGCLPLLIQMPVFLALYWVLLESYEIRHAPFMLWIQDLSAKDPYFILPVLMGASMWAMQKLQPTAATMDPMQQKIMQFLPIMMTVFFMFFPAGLVLYWLVNNLLSISQQLYITNKIEKEYGSKKKA